MIRPVLVASALIVVSSSQAPTPPSGQQLPTFRSGVDIVEIDVTVLDKDRHPVKGLTAADFTILDRGKPTPIVAFSAVDVPPPVSFPAPWMREAPIDVVSNVENRRLVTIVMDDAYTEFNPDFAKRAKQIAKNAVDQLGPADLAAVIFTYMGQRQNFTSDRTRLLAAIDSYVPKLTTAAGAPSTCSAALMRSCDIEALATAASTLSTATPGRKIAIVISGGRSFSFGGPGNTNNEGPELTKMLRDLNWANVTVYAFDARGLAISSGFEAENRRPPATVSPIGLNESLHTFAESTGGRAITNTNDPASHVAETFRESSSYYFIGFQTSGDSNAKTLQRVEVKVNRPGVQVQTRSGYYQPGKATEAGDVINGLPTGDLPVHATAAVVAVPGRREAEVIVATRVDPPGASSEPRTIELSAAAIDLDGKPRGILRQTITVTPNPARMAPDLPAHLPLAPGRYVVQVSAKSDGRAGGTAIDIDVPNFEKESLSASGLMLQRRPAPAIGDKAIENLIPFLPSTVRQFRTGDEVGVFVRIYQGGKGQIVPVRMTAKVTNEKNSVTSTQEAMLDVENFSAARSADYQVLLPLAHLTPGEHLLDVDAQSGARHVRRTARFTVVADR